MNDPRQSAWRPVARPFRVGLILASATVLAAGCGSQPAPPPAALQAAARTLTMDEKVLLALDYYDPTYKLDADGRVTRLRLSGKHLPLAVVTEIGKLTKLEGLSCEWTTITDEGVAQFKNLKNLRSISLVGTPITDKSLDHLVNMPSLQWTWVPRNSITEEGVKQAQKAREELGQVKINIVRL